MVSWFVAFTVLVLGSFAGYLWYCNRSLCRKLEQEHLANQQARRRLKRLGELSSEVAHEVKNPLTSILCSAETLDLLIGESLEPEHRRSLQFIKDYGDSMLRLVSCFLDLSRAESGLLKLEQGQVEVDALLESVSGLLFSHAVRNGVDLVHTVEQQDLIIRADQRHCRQILFNLIHNAVKFTPRGGRVEVNARFIPEHNQVEISVLDSGIGIAPERLNTLFESGESCIPADDEIELGVGLGLALTKKLLELNSGKIYVESGVGQGTRFSCLLPAGQYEEQPKGPTTMAIEQPHPLHGREFLVVGHSKDTQRSVCDLLLAWGGVVEKVENGLDALNLLEHREFDLVMIDEDLFDVPAVEFSKNFRTLSLHKQTPLVVALRHVEESQALREAGVDHCLEKPFNGRRLLSSVLFSARNSQ